MSAPCQRPLSWKTDSPEEARRREIAWLNLRWFMQTLLNRMDRTSMYSGLEARVPFADHRIMEYAGMYLGHENKGRTGKRTCSASQEKDFLPE